MCKCVCFLLVSAPLPLCPGLSSSPTVCEFIHRKCRRALRVAGLMRSDVASPASRELSMSGRSARGKQTVDKIFNTALPVHGSNTSEKDPLQNQKGVIRAPHLTSSEPRGFIKIPALSTETPVWRQCCGGIILVGRLIDSRPPLPPPSSFQGEESGLIESEGSKVQRDLSQPTLRRTQ